MLGPLVWIPVINQLNKTVRQRRVMGAVMGQNVEICRDPEIQDTGQGRVEMLILLVRRDPSSIIY